LDALQINLDAFINLFDALQINFDAFINLFDALQINLDANRINFVVL